MYHFHIRNLSPNFKISDLGFGMCMLTCTIQMYDSETVSQPLYRQLHGPDRGAIGSSSHGFGNGGINEMGRLQSGQIGN